MPKQVTYKDGAIEITFNADWAASKSEKDFVEHEKSCGLSQAQLKEAHGLCKKAIKPVETPADLAPENT